VVQEEYLYGVIKTEVTMRYCVVLYQLRYNSAISFGTVI